jgi:hypothetical protein
MQAVLIKPRRLGASQLWCSAIVVQCKKYSARNAVQWVVQCSGWSSTVGGLVEYLSGAVQWVVQCSGWYSAAPELEIQRTTTNNAQYHNFFDYARHTS